MRYRTSFTVSADPGTTFDYLADGRNGLWGHPSGTTVDQIPPGPIGLGTLFLFHRPSGPHFESTISAFEPSSRLGFLGGFQGQSPTEAIWTFAPFGSGTRLTVETESGFIGPRWIRPFTGLLTMVAWPLLILKMRGFKRRIARELRDA
jgi:hypothetical protein